MNNLIIDKIYGTLFGQAIGDALGVGTEFMTKQEARRNYPDGLTAYSQIIRDDHRSKFPRGRWTDDTDMMLCVARAIIKDKGVNLHTIAQNFKNWLYDPDTRDVGRTTYDVLALADYVENPKQAAKLIWRMSLGKNAANGAVMRTAVVGTLKENVAQVAEEICKLTHYDSRCVGSCVMVSEIISHLIWRDEQLTYRQIMDIAGRYDDRIAEYVDKVKGDNIAGLELDEHSSIGYTLKALSAALWCLFHARTFEDGLLAVVNEAGDADTNAAVACAVLGAKFGYATIHHPYIDGLVGKDDLAATVENLIKVLDRE